MHFSATAYVFISVSVHIRAISARRPPCCIRMISGGFFLRQASFSLLLIRFRSTAFLKCLFGTVISTLTGSIAGVAGKNLQTTLREGILMVLPSAKSSLTAFTPHSRSAFINDSARFFMVKRKHQSGWMDASGLISCPSGTICCSCYTP